MIEKTTYTEVLDRSFDCPYCGETYNQYIEHPKINANSERNIKEGKRTCPNCNKLLILENVQNMKTQPVRIRDDRCGRTTLTEIGAEIKEYKTEIIDKMPVAVAWRVNGGSGYQATMGTKGSAYIGRDKNGNLLLYIVIYSKFGMYQIRINKKRMLKMLTNAMKGVNRDEPHV